MLLEDYAAHPVLLYPPDGLTGRRKIKTPVKAVTADNVVDVVTQALGVHSLNAGEIGYLYNYYRGRQDIRGKKKPVRENINNKVTVNRANEIVTFKTAYLLNEPIQYISHGGNEDTAERVNRLNEFMRSEDKESKDKEIVDWMHICGVGERLVLPDELTPDVDGAPFNIYTLDPRSAFVIYNGGVGERPVAGVILELDEDGEKLATVYTPSEYFLLKNGVIVDRRTHILGGIPLVEYANNAARMGAFEVVLSILNSINVLESNAVDSVQDFVNGFDVFQNCEIAEGEYKELALGGKAVLIKTVTQGAEAKVYRVASEISQSGVQTRIDDLTDAYLTICGMPNRNGGTSTSDTGTAVIYRDGWSEAESRAKDTEKNFTRSEREFLRIVLRICRQDLSLNLSDIKTEFLRKNLANLQSKVQVLCQMLDNDKVHPLVAYETAAIAKDNLEAYRMGMEWSAEQEAKEKAELDAIANVRTGGGEA